MELHMMTIQWTGREEGIAIGTGVGSGDKNADLSKSDPRVDPPGDAI